MARKVGVNRWFYVGEGTLASWHGACLTLVRGPEHTGLPEFWEGAADSPRRGPDMTSANILIVDDEPEILEVLVEALERDGYRTEAVPDGAEALRRLEQQS